MAAFDRFMKKIRGVITIRDTESSWSQLVLRHREFLNKNLEPDFGLVDNLYSNKVLSDEEKANINAQNTVYKRNSKLLEYVHAKREYDGFIQALKSSNQAHVVKYLEKNGTHTFDDDWPLLDRERSILRANHETLIEILEVQDLLNRLYSAGVLNRRQVNFFSQKQTFYEKNESLLDILSRRSIGDYKKTIRCLHESDQSHIAQILEEGGGGNFAQKESPTTVCMEAKKQFNPSQINKSFQSQESVSDADNISEILTMIADEKMIGRGSYGYVYGPFSWRKQEWAVKKIAFEATKAMKKSLEEKRDLWTSLSHENLTKLQAVSLVEISSMAVLYIFMEYLGGDTLRNALNEHSPLPNCVVSVWAKQIANGMAYLHERNVVHRDLKSNNVLLTKGYSSNGYNEITLKIADFDEMREHSGTVTMTLIGTYGWMAPEVLLNYRFSKSSDVWSYGVVVWEMLTGDLPHKTLSHQELIKKAETGELAVTIPVSIPETLSQLLKYCFRLEDNNHPSFCGIEDLLRSSTTTTRGDPATRSERGAEISSESVFSSSLVIRTEQGTHSGIVSSSDPVTRSEQITNINYEMEPRILEGPYAYHAYIGFAKKEKEIAFKLRIQLENGGVSCVHRNSDVAVQSSILDGVNRSQKCLLLVTPDYLKDQWYQMETEAILQKAERFCRDMVMILKTSYDHEVPEKLRGFKEILITPEKLCDEKKMAHLIDDIVREPNVSLAAMPKQNVGYASAFNYYYDYLRLILPDFKKRLIDGTLGNEEELVRKAIKKMLIIMPESCFCPPSMTSKGKIEFTGKYVVRVACRAGNENRDYKTSLYKLIARDNSEYYFGGEFAIPLLTMYESYYFGLTGMTRDQLYSERDVFYFTLKSILSHSDNSDCDNQFRLLYWSDPKTDKSSRLTLYEFLCPVLQHELEEERANERCNLEAGSYMYDSISSPRPNLEQLCSFVNVDVGGSNPARDDEAEQAGNTSHPVRRHIFQSVREEDPRHDNGSEEEPRTQDSITSHNLLTEVQQGLEKLAVDIPPNRVREIKKEAPMVPTDKDGDSDEHGLGADAQSAPGLSTLATSIPLSSFRQKAGLVPGHPDFLMSYSTLPGSISYRDTQAGSLYVQALDECLRKRWELDRVLKSVSSRVREKLAERSAQDGVTERFQLPFHLTSGMDRTIYL